MINMTIQRLTGMLCLSVFWGSGATGQGNSVTIFTTDPSGHRIAQTDRLTMQPFRQPLETEPFVLVDPGSRFQQFLGVGGALTDASAETFARLAKPQQEELMKAYYDMHDGIGYTLARTNIQSCDFSSGSYSYVSDSDPDLKTFSVAHDEKYKIPLIKMAMTAAGGRLKLFVSPWSPPAWMKDNNSVTGGGRLKTEFAASWANFYVKFIRAYEAQGIPVWGLSVQNEPMATQKWESCIYTATEERDFIRDHLGPTLEKAGMASKKLIAWDHNRDLIYQRASTILEDPAAARYVWGIGFHWYETWTGSPMQFANVELVSRSFPSVNLIFTEGCKEKFSFDSLGAWSLGERYGYSILNDLNCGAVGWTDWNILLDEHGGPNHTGNFCFAPVHADTRTGKLIYTNAYYYIGQFSKFIQPGATRVASSTNRPVQLQTTAFRNPDGKLAVVVLNTSDASIRYRIMVRGNAVEAESKAHSIATLMIE
jgi:glucosylceramidase